MGSRIDKAACEATVYEVLVDGVSVTDARIRPDGVTTTCCPRIASCPVPRSN